MNALVQIDAAEPRKLLSRLRGGGLWDTQYTTEFLPAALEIVERPVSPTARLTAWVLLGGIAATLAWLAFGKVDVVAPASGRIGPVGDVKLVQSAEAGIVRRILVSEGQRVRKGQVLITLDPTISSAESDQVRATLLSAELEIARNRALIDALDGKGFHFVPPQAASPADIETHSSLARARLNEIQAMMAGGGSDRRAAMSASAEAEAQVQKLQQSLPLIDQQIAANEALAAKGYVSKLRVVEMRRQRIAETQDLAAARATVSRFAQQAHSASSTGVKSRAEARAQILHDLAKAEDDARSRRGELAKVGLRSSFREIRAPVTGTVSQLLVHTEGGIVEGAKPLMTVVPESAQLQLEVMVQNQDIGFVRAGMPVNVKLQAFPYTRYGTIPGVVEGLSADSVQVKEGEPPVYKARVSLSRSYMDADGRRIPLRAGLNATADIVTGRRTLLSYLVSPIVETSSEALHER
ncbi:HlyD family type I secretion periplasmic adaptor subunit [Sphingomonas sp. dw_22]|uniref:HlyD family type I secretion periplasmic adaptor subunit n=1 Tax=Sphingomonas sp. dw_22 TaxID=2721175 RepID=UPI001BD6BF3C|nr:HlyD family type I secretion periplasmic adaptor subunit [Sphingomonas sp. dw_22]